jgi:hypothetical protein
MRRKEKIEKEIDELMEEIKALGPMMRGSVTIMGAKNKQPYFSVGVRGKTKVIYLGEKRALLATKYLENYKRMLEIIEKMTVLNMELLKSMSTK